ncbi:MAG: hypothetical protein LBJ61_11110 [Deltaproteobacteria bacterium]|jgi:tetratricopeptide (TPR) repeat protein|nr:hypothetical protein [Deltaproteobacteria bacterium]
MVDFANLGPAGLINELDETLDVIYNLAGALGIGISPDGEFKAKVDKEDNETHRKRAKLALAQVKVRDLVEAIAGSPEAKAQEPLNLSLTMGKLINMYCLMELNNDAKQYFDALKPLIKTGASYWQLAACLNLLVIGYLDDGRFDQASSIYYENLKLSHIEEMAHGLVRSAFNLISRFVMCQQLARAHKIYNTMKLYCPNKPDLSLVSKGAKAEIAPELGPEAGPELAQGPTPKPVAMWPGGRPPPRKI